MLHLPCLPNQKKDNGKRIPGLPRDLDRIASLYTKRGRALKNLAKFWVRIEPYEKVNFFNGKSVKFGLNKEKNTIKGDSCCYLFVFMVT